LFCLLKQIIGRLSADAIVKWQIPIIGKLADTRCTSKHNVLQSVFTA